MKTFVRKILWKILGFDYQILLRKTDYVLLKDDHYTNVGHKTYDNGAKVWRWTDAPLNIGKYCSIAYDVNFIVDEGQHGLLPVTNFPLINNLFDKNEKIQGKTKAVYIASFKQKKGINIGNDVWIGMGAFIMPGVSVGNGVTIAANSVVTKDIPDYAMVGGVPAKIIKMKFSQEQIEKLNRIAWWHWDERKIKERIEDFSLPIDKFINKYTQ